MKKPATKTGLSWRRVTNGYGPMSWQAFYGHSKARIVRVYHNYKPRYTWSIVVLGKETGSGRCESLADAKKAADAAYEKAD